MMIIKCLEALTDYHLRFLTVDNYKLTKNNCHIIKLLTNDFQIVKLTFMVKGLRRPLEKNSNFFTDIENSLRNRISCIKFYFILFLHNDFRMTLSCHHIIKISNTELTIHLSDLTLRLTPQSTGSV